MLLPYQKTLAQLVVVLGSQSQRRRELLTLQLGKEPEIFASEFAEDFDKSKFATPADYVLATCVEKSKEIIARRERDKLHWDILVCADTICITEEGTIVEKPQDENHCIEIIQAFNSKSLEVQTAVFVAIRKKNGLQNEYFSKNFIEKSSLKFATLPAETIQHYAKTSYPWGKAGGIGVQDLAGSFIESINGCFSNVIGLPLHSLCRVIIQLLGEGRWLEENIVQQ